MTETAVFCHVIHGDDCGAGAGGQQVGVRGSVAHLLFCHLKETCFTVAGFPEGRTTVCAPAVTGRDLRGTVWPLSPCSFRKPVRELLSCVGVDTPAVKKSRTQFYLRVSFQTQFRGDILPSFLFGQRGDRRHASRPR